jgi:molybdenum cofactor guanylyltransferase
MRRGVIVLCGGRSSRMGCDKASLPFGQEQMLQRVVRLAGASAGVDCIAVVAGKAQLLPDLPHGVIMVRDADDYQGPLSGLATGMRAIADRLDAVFVTGCDVPLLAPAFVDRLFELLDDHEAVATVDAVGVHPLAAVYRTSILDQINNLLARGERRMQSLIEAIDVRKISAEDLQEVDPQLGSLRNVNTQDDCAVALAVAGIPHSVDVEKLPLQREARAGQ